MTLPEIKTLIQSIDRSPGVYHYAGVPKSLAEKMVERIEKLSEVLEQIAIGPTPQDGDKEVVAANITGARSVLRKYGRDVPL